MILNQQLASSAVLLHNMLLIFSLLLLAVDATPYRPFPKGLPTGRDGEFLVKLRMKGAVPKQDGDKICQGFTLQKGDEFWVKQFRAVTKFTPHHIGLYACDYIPADGSPCTCPLENRTLVYSWVRHTPPHRLPPNVGFHVGGNSESQFLILQVHYRKLIDFIGGDLGVDLHITRDKQKYVAGYYTPEGPGTIPPRQKDFTLEGCSKVDRNVPFHVFAYQPHGHFMSQLVTTYKISKKSGEMDELGRGNPLFPEAHYPLPRIIDVEPGDTIIIRCLFDSRNQSNSTNTNFMPAVPGAPLEMCNFHLLYYADSAINTKNHFKLGKCTEKEIASLPKNSMKQLQPNAQLLDHALNGNQKGIFYINENITLNLDLEDFESLFGPYSKEDKQPALIGKH